MLMSWSIGDVPFEHAPWRYLVELSDARFFAQCCQLSCAQLPAGARPITVAPASEYRRID